MKARFARWAEMLGVPGIAGMALLAGAIAFYFGTIRPVQPRLLDLQKEQVRLEAQHATGMRQNGTAMASPLESRLRVFYEKLATSDSIGERFETIDAIARQHGVVLRQGNYRLASEPGAQFGRYELSYTGQSAYFQARLFIRDVLRQLPMIALDEVSFQRQQTSAVATELSARFTLLVKAEH